MIGKVVVRLYMLRAVLGMNPKTFYDSQIKEMNRLYHFAEIGQQSTAVLHELANNLTTLTLDIEEIQQNDHSPAVVRARETIDQIDMIIKQAIIQIRSSPVSIEFDPIILITSVLQQLTQKANQKGIRLTINPSIRKTSILIGDPTRLSQVISILVTNAIGAYENLELSRQHKKEIILTAIDHQGSLVISVQDFGVGISKAKRRKLFHPHQSSKNGGLGIGLYIARSIIITHFRGSLAISPRTDCTVFILKIPVQSRSM